jgi:hypothetical protein
VSTCEPVDGASRRKKKIVLYVCTVLYYVMRTCRLIGSCYLITTQHVNRSFSLRNVFYSILSRGGSTKITTKSMHWVMVNGARCVKVGPEKGESATHSIV